MAQGFSTVRLWPHAAPIEPPLSPFGGPRRPYSGVTPLFQTVSPRPWETNPFWRNWLLTLKLEFADGAYDAQPAQRGPSVQRAAFCTYSVRGMLFAVSGDSVDSINPSRRATKPAVVACRSRVVTLVFLNSVRKPAWLPLLTTPSLAGRDPLEDLPTIDTSKPLQ